ncbi:MAG: glycerol-3-phosphate responsive antiterminator [Epulopiscium sp.]|nr:glycerol-3-phosphate responsive antiterminator [Candidatus Epulonipiscium sp.]
MLHLEENPIVAAVRTDEEFEAALVCPCNVIFMLNANVLNLENFIKKAHEQNKKVFVHVDVSEGIGKDHFGLGFIAKTGAEGIISTRMNLIRMAKDWNLKTVQRVFIMDSKSIDTAVEMIRSVKPDLIEVMPGIIPRVIKRFCERVSHPVIAGGLIESKEDMINSLEAGALAISTGKSDLWYK